MNEKDSFSDEKLAILHQKKRLNAFFILYKRYKNYGYAVVYQTLQKYKLINALKDERDVIVYESIMEALDRYNRSRGTFRQLFSSIIENQTKSQIREFRKDPLSDYISLDASYKEGSLRFADSDIFMDRHNNTPKDAIDEKEGEKKIGIDYNGVHKRRIDGMLKLKKEGYTFKEIAKKFKTTEKSVRSVFYRIKKRYDIKKNNKIKK